MPRDESIRKVLMIGSGPIVIGQAAEFDYAGAQACRVLKSAGVNVVLCNSNPATIMTDSALADEIYLEPLTLATIKRIIDKEKPDSLLAGLGGQTGLTLAMQLDKEGFLESRGVRLLGTNAEAIDRAEDRQRFKDTMREIGQPVIPSDVSETVEGCLEIADRIGYPVIVRPAFTLGGAGGGVAYDAETLAGIAANGLLLSPITQVLIEKYIFGWKEIEFEVMRDGAGNVVAVCSMENIDPVGVHTGDSIVVAPALTLSSREYDMLRTAALDIITALKVAGGCNVQFALDPNSFEYAVIEVNPRVSRSSALASKATGYPIAKVTTQIALGYTLDEIRNDVTGKTCACFEPAIDYVVVKFPKWPFDKFVHASRRLGTQMKATGEVMAIAPSFEMALMKAVRGAELGIDTLNMTRFLSSTREEMEERLQMQDDLRLFAIFRALKLGTDVDFIYDKTRVDRWFLRKLKRLADFENSLARDDMTEEKYLLGKRLGYSDGALLALTGNALPPAIRASYKMVDTCAGEFAAATPYFYAVYEDVCEARERPRSEKKRMLVLGSGPIRIGQGIEFDYSSVHCVWTLKQLGYEVALINNNPETVSTDFDTADRLYFEPLTEEDVLNVIDVERPETVVVAFGGQTAINLTKALDRRGIKILGTSAEGIDMAEDRERFDTLLESLGMKRPAGLTVMTLEEALHASHALGFPVLLRPSYVIGGQNMTIAYTERDVTQYMERILAHPIDNPVMVDKYLMGKELEVDVISDGTDVLLPGIMEHVERAGVHSGDSIAMYPPATISDNMTAQIVSGATRLALALGTKGLVNIQYLIYQNELYVIEVNPRASRTIPYISKVTGVPMADVATRVMVGYPLRDLGYGVGLYKTPPYTAVKVPVFSFEKLSDVNAALGPEMKSTGEALGVGRTPVEALYKGLLSAGFGGKISGVLITVADEDKPEVLSIAKKFHDLGVHLFATRGTARAIAQMDIAVTFVMNCEDAQALITDGRVDAVVFTGASRPEVISDYIRLHRHALLHGVPCMTSLDTASAVADIIASGFSERSTALVDIARLRGSRQTLRFTKMEGTGDDYIFFDNRDGQIDSPEALAITLCDRHRGVGGYGVVLIEGSDTADARMRVYNRDGSEGGMAGNAIRCVGKYLYDKGIARKERMTVETRAGLRTLWLSTVRGEAQSARVDMGAAEFSPARVPVLLGGDRIVDRAIECQGRRYRVTCLSLGNPHCVVFTEHIDRVDVKSEGAALEHMNIFPERANIEFVRVADAHTLRMRAWERGNGETPACGTGACAAVVAAIENGFCQKDTDITVKLRGGDLVCRWDGDRVYLTGNASLIYEGTVEY